MPICAELYFQERGQHSRLKHRGFESAMPTFSGNLAKVLWPSSPPKDRLFPFRVKSPKRGAGRQKQVLGNLISLCETKGLLA